MTNRPLVILGAYFEASADGADETAVLARIRLLVPDAGVDDVVAAAGLAKSIGKTLNRLAWRFRSELSLMRALGGQPAEPADDGAGR